jgi:hypothetical protein
VFAADRTHFPAEVFSQEAFTWAAATVRGRIHAPLDAQQLALVPLADAVSVSQGLCVKAGSMCQLMWQRNGGMAAVQRAGVCCE